VQHVHVILPPGTPIISNPAFEVATLAILDAAIIEIDLFRHSSFGTRTLQKPVQQHV
jgi:hypothetical protein